jgi:hypothetical protein
LVQFASYAWHTEAQALQAPQAHQVLSVLVANLALAVHVYFHSVAMVRVIVEVVPGPVELVPAGTAETAGMEVEVATPLSVSAAVKSETVT